MRSLLLALLLLPAAASAQVTPGQWEIVTTVQSMDMPGVPPGEELMASIEANVQSMDMPGVPPGIAAMMKGKPITMKHCITPEEAARGPQEAMKTDKSCKFTDYSMAGGKLRATMICTRGGQTMTSTSTGIFTADSFTAAGRTVGTGSQPMTITATTTGKRIGACK